MNEEPQGLTNLLGERAVNSEVLQFKVRFPESEVARHLMIEKTDPIYEIRHVRYVEEEPYVIEQMYMPSSLINVLTKEILDSSIYRYIQEELGYTITSSHKMIRADKLNPWDGEYPGNEETNPVIEVEQIVFLGNGKPLEYSFSRDRYDKSVFTSVHIGR